jgi:threonine/homoserine/homoserine lactone efflux protein
VECEDVPVQLLPFLAVAVVVVITPGVDMALVTKNAFVHGRRQALATAFGINAGIAVWTVAAALGVAAAVQASAAAFAVIKCAGALYLVYLGAQALRSARRAPAEAHALRSGLGAAGAFRQGLVSNLLNPKSPSSSPASCRSS